MVTPGQVGTMIDCRNETNERYAMNKKRRLQHKNHPALLKQNPGQAIVLIALVMVALLGFTALAIDGGQLYFLQRDAQNAADAALVAALFELCRDPTLMDTPEEQEATAGVAIEAGKNAAEQNGFVTGPDATVTVRVPYDPGTGLSYNHVEVEIIASKPAQLVQVVYQGPLEVRARTTGHCQGGHSFDEGYAMFAGGSCGDKTLEYSGSDADITGGLGSNGGVYVSGPGSTVDEATGSPVTCQAGAVCESMEAPAEPMPMPIIPDWDIKKFRPPDGEWVIAAGSHFYDVSSGSLPAEVDGRLPKGIYYSSGDIDANDAGSDPSGITWVAEGQIQFQSPGDGWSPYAQIDMPPMPLLFSNRGDRSCTKSKDIKTSGEIGFVGVIYAPNGQVEISFSSGYTYDGAIYAWLLNLSGSDFELNFNPDYFPPVKPVVGISD